jgi:hypothetical protein
MIIQELEIALKEVLQMRLAFFHCSKEPAKAVNAT